MSLEALRELLDDGEPIHPAHFRTLLALYDYAEQRAERAEAALQYVIDWLDPDEFCEQHAPGYNKVNGKTCDSPSCDWCQKHQDIMDLLEAGDGD